jgi:hypothetical protein
VDEAALAKVQVEPPRPDQAPAPRAVLPAPPGPAAKP